MTGLSKDIQHHRWQHHTRHLHSHQVLIRFKLTYAEELYTPCVWWVRIHELQIIDCTFYVFGTLMLTPEPSLTTQNLKLKHTSKRASHHLKKKTHLIHLSVSSKYIFNKLEGKFPKQAFYIYIKQVNCVLEELMTECSTSEDCTRRRPKLTLQHLQICFVRKCFLKHQNICFWMPEVLIFKATSRYSKWFFLML